MSSAQWFYRTTPQALDAYRFTRSWAWQPMLLWIVGAALVFGSWLFPPTRALWDLLDAAVFYTLNATIIQSQILAAFWAVTGDRRFDYFAALIVFAIYMRHISRGSEERLTHGLAYGAVTAIVLLVAVAIEREIIAWPHLSPSGVLEPFHSLREAIPWSRAKEISPTSFPADHGTVMMILILLWWRGDGRRLGLTMALLGVLFVLPRLAAGAHWATDTLVGGAFVAMLTMAVVEGTPICWWLYRGMSKTTAFALDLLKSGVAALAPPNSPPLPPQSQVLRGLCIGAADLVPGVSGSTMALILGIYRRLLAAISNVDRELLSLLLRGKLVEALRRVDAGFILPLMVGVVLALALFSRVIPLSVLLVELPEIMFGLFFGLVAASVVHLLRGMLPLAGLNYSWLALGLCLGVAIATLVPIDTPQEAWFIFLCGMAAIVAMLLPGVSGAFVLLLLGKYADAIDALGSLDLAFILPLAAGAGVGAILFSRAVTWFLNNYYRPTMLTVIGMVGGSMLAIWPFQDRDYQLVGGKLRMVSSNVVIPGAIDLGVVLGLVAVVAGVLSFRLLIRLSDRAQDREERERAVQLARNEGG